MKTEVSADTDLMLPADVGRLAARTPSAVVRAVDRGALRALRTPSGVRLIRRDDAERWAGEARQRDARRQGKHA